MSINEEIRKERDKLKEKSVKEKINYYWYYYKIHALIIFMVLLFLVYFVSTIYKNSIPSALYAVVLNTDNPYDDHTPFMEEFCEYAGINYEKYQVIMDSSLYINRENPDNTSMLTNQKLVALFSAGSVDVYISDPSNFENFAAIGAFLDIRELLPADAQEELKDSFYYHKSEEYGDIPIGIQLKNYPKFTNEGFSSYDAILGIPVNAPQKENSVKFLNFLTQKE